MNKRTYIRVGILILTTCLYLSCDGPLFVIPRDSDTTPPSATMVNPPHEAVLSGEILIKVVAEDNDGIDSVEIFIDDILVTVDLDSPYTYIWSTLDTLYFDDDTLFSKEDYHHSITSRITDFSENDCYTDPILIWIDNFDNIPPSGEFQDLYWGKTVSGVIPITVLASDNEGVESVIIFLEDEILLDDNTDPYTYDLNTVELEEKNYSIRAIIEDLSGNRTTIGPIQLLVDNLPDIDSTPPNVVITYPAAAQTVSDSINITVEATDDDAMNYVEFFINGESILEDYILPYTYLWNTLDPSHATEDEEHIIHVVAYDISGNSASPSPISVFVDNTESEPPAVVITEPSAGQTVNGIVHISITAMDNIEVSFVECFLNDELLFTDDSYPYTFDWNTVSVQEDTWQTIRVSATDINGNSSLANPINVLVDNNDDIAPTGMILNPYAGQIVSGIINIQVEAADNIGVQSVQFNIDGDPVFTDTIFPYEFPWDTEEALEDNNHTISILIEDVSENITALQPIVVYVDNLTQGDEFPPVVSIQNPLSGQTVNGIVTIEIIASDNIGIDSVKCSINQELMFTSHEGFVFEWNTVTWGPNGEAVIQVEAVDLSGNSTYAQSIYVIVNNDFDGSPEFVNVETIQPGEILVSWSSSIDAISYRIYRNNEFLIQTTDTYYNDTDIVPNIDYCYSISAINQYEIESAISDPVCIDDILPATTNLITTVLNNQEISLSWSTVVGAASYQVNVFGVPVDTTAGTTFVHSDLSDNVEYCYTINALDSSEDPGTLSNEVCATTHTTLTAPTLNVTADATSINLSWTTVPTATDYHIYRDGVFLTETTSLQYTDSTVDPGTEYCYTVLAVNEYGTTGPESNQACDRVLLPAPTTVNVEAVSTSSIQVTWSSVIGSVSYSIYQNDQLIDANATSPYTINGLENNTLYCYSIHGIDADGVSGVSSEEVCATTHTTLTAPTLNVTADATSINLSWTTVPTATDYHIYRDGVFLTETTSLQYTDSTVDPGTEYCYTVLAVNEYGTTGPESNQACDRVLVQPPSQEEFEVTGGDQSVFINWSEISGAASYNLYLSSPGTRDLILLTNTTNTFYTHNELSYETTYCYAISCIDADGFEGSVSTDQCATTDPEPAPLPPGSFTVTQVDSIAELNWVSSISDNVEHILIYKNSEYFTSVEVNVQTYTDTTVTQGFEYCYYLIARTFNNTDSDPSTTQCITIE